MSESSAGGKSLNIRALGAGVFQVTTDGRSRLAYATGPVGARWVFIDGLTYVIDLLEADASGSGRRRDEDALAAPMPATVSTIKVTPGQQVSAGDVLIVLEAMKMELSVTAPRAGTVRAVNCQAGELVQPGEPLVDLE